MFEHDVYLTIGKINDIRSRFYAPHRKLEREKKLKKTKKERE